ncbi:MAG: hypothetical protein AAF433_04735 [Bacteroidota bacterium]
MSGSVYYSRKRLQVVKRLAYGIALTIFPLSSFLFPLSSFLMFNPGDGVAEPELNRRGLWPSAQPRWRSRVNGGGFADELNPKSLGWA